MMRSSSVPIVIKRCQRRISNRLVKRGLSREAANEAALELVDLLDNDLWKARPDLWQETIQ